MGLKLTQNITWHYENIGITYAEQFIIVSTTKPYGLVAVFLNPL